MAVGDNNITIREIFNEVNTTSHGSGATISNCDLETLAAASVGTRAGGGAWSGGSYVMDDWAGYVHTQNFGTPTYYAKTGTATGDWCIHSASSAQTGEAISNATVIFYAILNGTTVECYMVPDHTQFQQNTTNEYAAWKNTSGTLGSFTGNFSSGFTAVKIAELDTGSVSNREVSITTAVISGTGSYDTSISGYTNVGNGTFFTPSSTKNMRAPNANAFAACYNTVNRLPFHSVEFRVKADGYNTKVFNKFITSLSATATSNSCF